jgi:hypothetical protein
MTDQYQGLRELPLSMHVLQGCDIIVGSSR